MAPYATGQPLQASAALQCLNLRTDDGKLASAEVIWAVTDWLTRQVRSGAPRPASIIIEADHVDSQQIEQLSDLCHSHDVRLTNLFRHLRDGALRSLGGGSAGFLRLQPPDEASKAADYIGQEHSFRITSFTTTLGGGVSHSTTWHGDSYLGLWWADPHQHQTSHQTNWTNAEGSQRVYEYVVEPSTFQALPEFALLLVEHTPAGAEVQVVECSPRILTLPRVSTAPLPDNPRAGIGRQPGHVTAAGPITTGEPADLAMPDHRDNDDGGGSSSSSSSSEGILAKIRR